jgi:hypothetical protein
MTPRARTSRLDLAPADTAYLGKLSDLIAVPSISRDASRCSATPVTPAIADNTNQKQEQTMTILEYLMKAVQDDARRAGERDRLRREARRARRARRQRLVPAAPARRRTGMGKIIVSENVTLDGVIQDRPVTKASGPAAGSA